MPMIVVPVLGTSIFAARVVVTQWSGMKPMIVVAANVRIMERLDVLMTQIAVPVPLGQMMFVEEMLVLLSRCTRQEAALLQVVMLSPNVLMTLVRPGRTKVVEGMLVCPRRCTKQETVPTIVRPNLNVMIGF